MATFYIVNPIETLLLIQVHVQLNDYKNENIFVKTNQNSSFCKKFLKMITPFTFEKRRSMMLTDS